MVGPKGYVHGWKFVGVPGGTEEKQALIKHMVESHNVSEAMLRRGGGPGGSSRPLSHLRQTHASFAAADNEYGGEATPTSHLAVPPTRRSRSPMSGPAAATGGNTSFRQAHPEQYAKNVATQAALDEARKRGIRVGDKIHSVAGLPGTGGTVVSTKGRSATIKRPDGSLYTSDKRDIITHRLASALGMTGGNTQAEKEAAAQSRPRNTADLSPAEKVAAGQMGSVSAHRSLLRARREARAKYPAGHPERLAAERNVRQSRKRMTGGK